MGKRLYFPSLVMTACDLECVVDGHMDVNLIQK